MMTSPPRWAVNKRILIAAAIAGATGQIGSSTVPGARFRPGAARSSVVG